MEGVIELAEEVFHLPVRLGVPGNVSGLVDVVKNPIYATGVGLLIYGSKQQSEQRRERLGDWGGKSMWQRMKSWFQGNF
jgi:cell division protein FtsA